MVAMVQAAEPWEREDLATRDWILRYHAASRSLLVEPQICSVVIIADVVLHHTLEMPFIQNNHMVEQVASAVADGMTLR